MATPRVKKKPAAKKPAAKRPLPAALAKRAKALHDAAQQRLIGQGREASALIRDRRESIADNYFDVGQALLRSVVECLRPLRERGEHGPLVESRVPLRDLRRVAGLPHKGR